MRTFLQVFFGMLPVAGSVAVSTVRGNALAVRERAAEWGRQQDALNDLVKKGKKKNGGALCIVPMPAARDEVAQRKL